MRLNNKGFYDSFFITDIFMSLIFFMVLVVFPMGAFISHKNSAEIESRMYNEKYGTHYTAHDFFWSGGTIKEYLNGGKQNTQNLNINGAIPVTIAK